MMELDVNGSSENIDAGKKRLTGFINVERNLLHASSLLYVAARIFIPYNHEYYHHTYVRVCACVWFLLLSQIDLVGKMNFPL